MHSYKKILFGLLAPVLLFISELVQAEVLPPEYFALRPVIGNVSLSPNGEYLAMLKIQSRDANPVIEIYKTDQLDKEPFRVNASPMEIDGFRWVNDENIVMELRQKVRDDINGFNQGVFEYSAALLNVRKEKLTKIKGLGAYIAETIPSDPNAVVFAFYPEDSGRKGASGGDNAVVTPRSFYRYDLSRGTKRLILRGSWNMGRYRFNGDGEPWYAEGYDELTKEFIYYARDEGEWVEVYRNSNESFDNFEVVGFDVAAPHLWFVLSNRGQDKRGLWEFNSASGKFGELIYARKDVDISGVRMHSNSWSQADTVTAVAFYKHNYRFAYFDGEEEALYKQLEELTPNSQYIQILSRSKDNASIVFRNTSAKDPGSYYLVHEGRLTKVGEQQPLLQPENLSEVKYIQYPARDGKTVPAFVTVPQGKAPFPLIVMPHGGPFVAEQVFFDRWAQLLANNGYMVLQPQYRGSMNYGQEHYTSAFLDGGKGGYSMQDDKDDGALYLVEKGLVDKDRMAMFGWSYGGYAALIAASRDEQIYQCAIAGAAVADNDMQLNYYVSQLDGASRIQQERFWRDSISPVDVAEKVNVPLLIVHGSVDQRVPLKHAKRYLDALDAAKIKYEYMELEGADHFSNTLTFDHQKKFYTRMLSFLAEDCGPEGL